MMNPVRNRGVLTRKDGTCPADRRQAVPREQVSPRFLKLKISMYITDGYNQTNVHKNHYNQCT